jgi:hypothetical protein
MGVWQNRPLERIYAVVLIDAIVIKVATPKSRTGRCTWRSALTWTGVVTCWDVAGPDRRGRR